MQHVRSLAESRGRSKTEPLLLARWENAKYVFDRLSPYLSLEFVIVSAFSRSSVTHTHLRRRLFLGRFSLL